MYKCHLAAASALALLLSWASAAYAQTVRQYDVRFTTNTIVADGINSPGEWDGAATTGGAWNELRQPFGDADTNNNEFRMLWDDTNLYLRWQNNFTGWNTADTINNNPPADFSKGSISIYFDPNTTGEPNNVPDNQVDGYEFAINTLTSATGERLISTDADRAGVGIFTEAHVDNLFGNQANWGGSGSSSVNGDAMQEIVVAQNNQTSGRSAGGYVEVVFPWANFNADAEIPRRRGPIQTGLNHPFAPVNGEEWFFNLGFTNPVDADNFLPVWNWTPSNAFASHGNLAAAPGGHGEITFVGRIPEPSTLALLALGVVGLSRHRRRTR